MAAILRAYAPALATIMGAVALIAAAGTGVVMAQPSMGCTNPIVSLSPCLAYMTGPAKPILPSDVCCIALARVITSDAACLCQLFASNDFLGFPINQTLALSLPSDCNLLFPREIEQCTGVFPPPNAGSVDLPDNPALDSPPPPSAGFRGSNPPPAPPSPFDVVPPVNLPPAPVRSPISTNVPAKSPGQVQSTSPTPRDTRKVGSLAGALLTPSLFGISLGSIFTSILTVGCFL